jgi:hypothetical protein
MHFYTRCNLNTTYSVLGRKETIRRRTVIKLPQFQIHPPLNFLTVPKRLTVKFHYSLIGPKFKILNMLILLALI